MRTFPRSILLCTALSLVAGGIAISGQSLWIDEAHAAVKAMAPSWETFAARMKLEAGSDAQMPAYMAMLWAWEKVAGHSEWALRALNLPLWVLAISLFYIKGPGTVRFRQLWIAFALCSPFLWFYLDEARPYIMQFTASTIILCAGSSFCSDKKIRLPDFLWFCVGMFLLCASSLTGVIFGFYFGLAGLFFIFRRPGIIESGQLKIFGGITLLFAVLFSLLGFYYLQTLLRGAAASTVGKTNVQTLLFSGYEFLGFSGLGPSRLQLRLEAVTALRSYIPGLAIFAGVWALFLGAAFFRWVKKSEKTIPGRVMVWLPAVMAGAVSLVGVGVWGEFRVLGRHFMPLMPFVLCVFAGAAVILWKKKWVVLPVLLLGLSLFSALTTRFAERHAKDDYRAAAKVVEWSSGALVWWAADTAAAEYYGVLQVVSLINNPTAGELEELLTPDLVVFSKPDIYDPDGCLTRYLSGWNYQRLIQMPAISLWSTQPEIPSEF